MSTDDGFRLRNGTRRPTDGEVEAGVAMDDSSHQTPEEREAFLSPPTKKAAMTFLNPRKRKHIGVVQSLKVIANSSGVFLLCLFMVRRTCSSDLY